MSLVGNKKILKEQERQQRELDDLTVRTAASLGYYERIQYDAAIRYLENRESKAVVDWRSVRYYASLMTAAAMFLTGCTRPLVALCEPDVEGCQIIEYYDDALSCNFAAMARNGKDEARNNLRCMEIKK